MKKIIVLPVLFFCLFLSILKAEEGEREMRSWESESCENCCYEKCCKEIKKFLKNIEHDTGVANSQLRMLFCIAESIKSMLNCDLCCKINHTVGRVDVIHENTRKVPGFLESMQDMLCLQLYEIQSKLDILLA